MEYHPLFQKIWEQPQSLQNGRMAYKWNSEPKQGDLSECKKQRGIENFDARYFKSNKKTSTLRIILKNRAGSSRRRIQAPSGKSWEGTACQKILIIIKKTDDEYEFQVIHQNKSSDPFPVKIGVIVGLRLLRSYVPLGTSVYNLGLWEILLHFSRDSMQ